MITVLVVEDDRKLRGLLRSYLERAGMTVLSTASGAEAIMLVRSGGIDAIVLDLGLPDVSGEAVAHEILGVGHTPTLVLTGRAGLEDRIRGLELGVDDYVTKPFSPREIVLRLQAILRRGAGNDGQDRVISFGCGMMVVDEARRTVMVNSIRVGLTPTEWGILIALTAVPGRVYSRFELINRVRGHEFNGYERTVDSHIKNLRRKLEADPHQPCVIETVLGGGYRLGLDRDD